MGVGVNPRRPVRWPSWKIHTMAPKTAVRLSDIEHQRLEREDHASGEEEQDDEGGEHDRGRWPAGAGYPRSCFWSTSAAAGPPT